MKIKASLAALLLAITTPLMAADVYAPPSGTGPAVILLSGSGGTFPFRWYAQDVAKLGYTAVLVSGKEVCASSSSSCSRSDSESLDALRKTIAEAQRDKRVVAGKVAVIGFSLGGGGALVHAAPLAEAVSGVVAYYPSISKLPDIAQAASRVATPTLVLAGGKDRLFNCCLVGSMQAFAAGTRSTPHPTELVVYPDADHVFNLDGSKYRPDDTADAWERTKAFLARVLPLP